MRHPLVVDNKQETAMPNKTTIALATALIIGTLGSAYAGAERDSGGYDIGPMGQCFSPPDCGNGASQSRADKAFAYVPGHRTVHRPDSQRAR
jgi:hypothetical protein